MGDYLAYLGQLTYLLTFAAYCARNMKHLRLLALLASAFAVVYALEAQEQIPWLPVIWHGLFFLANLVHLSIERWRARSVALRPLESFLAQTALRNFPPAEVKSFTAICSLREAAPGDAIVIEDTELDSLYCIIKGTVDVLLGGQKVAELVPGCFVGEMSLLTHSRTRASVVAATPIKALAWPHSQIEEWVGGDPARLSLLQAALGTQVVEQLLRQGRELEAG